MNVAGWRQRAMTARLRGNHFCSLWTADSELKGFLHRLLKSHFGAAVVITQITTLWHRGVGGVVCGGSHSEKKLKEVMIFLWVSDVVVCRFIGGGNKTCS